MLSDLATPHTLLPEEVLEVVALNTCSWPWDIAVWMKSLGFGLTASSF